MDRAHASRLSRLHRDLTELLENPYPGVAVFIDDANIRKFCLVLTPPSGPWKDLALHFDVYLPEDWPTHPPNVSCTVHDIQHPNLFDSYICCDLLKPQDELEEGYTGGYTPALTLRGLLLQFLTFFSSNKVEQDTGYTVHIGEDCEVSYVREYDLDAHIFSSKTCCRDHWPCHCKTPSSSQRELEREWEADSGPIDTVGKYHKLLHQVKGKSGDAQRIHRFERRNPIWEETYRLISRFRCPSCPYGSDDLPHLKPTSLAPPDEATVPSPSVGSKCYLSLLNDDVLSEIAGHLTSESLISFGKAYHRMHNIVRSMHMLIRRELACFYLRTPIQDSIMGIGVAIDYGARTLSSDFDWLSYDAFNNHGVRRSIQKRYFEFFLPLAFNRAHFARAYNQIWPFLKTIDFAIRQVSTSRNSSGRHPEYPPLPHETVRVLYKMMNNIVVSLMKSCDDVLQASQGVTRQHQSRTTLLHASEKAVISYCHLFHLLICLCRTNPEILRDAMNRLERFKKYPASRVKRVVPDLGELIVLIILVGVLPLEGRERMDWSMINGPVLEEAIVRNVRWVLQKSPELEQLEDGVSGHRLSTTFQNSKTSLRLMMFQITFLNVFIRVYGGTRISKLDDNYGFAEAGIAEGLVEAIKRIYRVQTWPDFFKRVRFERGTKFTKAQFCSLLRSAVKMSAERGYHTPGEFRRRRVNKY